MAQRPSLLYKAWCQADATVLRHVLSTWVGLRNWYIRRVFFCQRFVYFITNRILFSGGAEWSILDSANRSARKFYMDLYKKIEKFGRFQKKL